MSDTDLSLDVPDPPLLVLTVEGDGIINIVFASGVELFNISMDDAITILRDECHELIPL